MSGQHENPDFESAIQHAIEQSQEAFQELRQKINDALSRLEQAAKNLKSRSIHASPSQSCQNNSTSKLADNLASIFNQCSQDITQLFERQHEHLSTFNIVLFGRTGAGKSSLIETFARGNGASVSRGESDWTTEVRPLQWNSCLLYDTPGISGWGRTMSRSQLEENAHRAVEIADVILVCFDSQSQQAAEFHKVADWVQRYGKPVIAVLNQRNSRWRMPSLVPNVSARRSLSQSVTEHTSNIRDELGKIGLVGVPIVAISTKRALFAKATEPFQGPDAETLTAHRSQYGIEQLERWSNFPALETLIIEAIIQDAVGLRLGMLREQTCGVLQKLIDELIFWQEKVSKLSNILEATIEGYLRVVGCAPSNSSKESNNQTDLLKQLEELRGKAFSSPMQGEFQDYTKHLLSTHFSRLRANSHAQAEELVIAAFENKKTLSSDDFKAQVFNKMEIEEAAKTILEEAVKFLERKTKLISRDANSDFDFEIYSAEAQGQAGQDWKWAQYAAQAVMIFSSVASTLGTLALANWWNPLGWTAGVGAAVGLIGGIVSLAFGWAGKKAQQKAEKERLEKRRTSLNQARKSVNETYDLLIEKIAEATNQISQEIAFELLQPSLHEAIILRQAQNETEATQKYLTAILKAIPLLISAQLLLAQAASSVEKNKFPNDSQANRKLWLGEDWILDPTGLRTEANDSTIHIERENFNLFPPSFEEIRSVFARMSRNLQSGMGVVWLEEARHLLANEQEAFIFLDELQALLKKGKPRLQFCGDYNAGKTSFIKRLLIELEETTPESLEIQARPTTSEVIEYEWDEILLVDSPGLQSNCTDDTEVTLRSFPDATAIVYLFQPNLITGDTQAIDLILKGDEKLGILTKLERTFFIINRSDELGVDPNESPEEYKRLYKRKKEELVLALRSRGINVSLMQVCCMASDPYGLVGTRQDANSSDFDLNRHWDGFDYFIATYYSMRDEILQVGLDLSVLEGGIARLGRLIVSASETLEGVQRKEESLNHLCQTLKEALNECDLMRKNIESEFKRMVTDHARGLGNDALSAKSEAEIQKTTQLLSQWWKDKDFQEELRQWQNKAHKDIKTWYEKNQKNIKRRFESAEFRYAFPGIERELNGKKSSTSQVNQTKKFFRILEKSFKGSTRNAVYEVVKFFQSSYKFKPWGAVKLARNVAKVGAYMGIIGLCLDVYLIMDSWQQEEKREKARKEIKKFVEETAEEFCNLFFKDSNSPITYLKEKRNELQVTSQLLHIELEDLSKEHKFNLETINRYEVLKKSAMRKLGLLLGEDINE